MDFMRAKSEMDAVAEARIQGNKKAAELIVKTVVNTYKKAIGSIAYHGSVRGPLGDHD